jgi:peptidyl-tRNA hydrolase
MAIHEKFKEMRLEVHLITDSGRTEFYGQPTRSCLAIGPDDAAKSTRYQDTSNYSHLRLIDETDRD